MTVNCLYKKVSGGKTKYINNYIYHVIVRQIVYADVVHRVSYNVTMLLVENSFIIDSHYNISLIDFSLIIFLKLLLLVMDFISGEWLFHILVPWSNIDFLEICSLNRGVLIERLLQVSYVWYEQDMNLLQYF